jgi:hypothetical protein
LQADTLPDIIHHQPINLTWLPLPHRLDYKHTEEKIMKPVKNFALAMLLASFLAISAPAGELGTPGAVATPTPSPDAVRITSGGEIVISYGDPNAAVNTTDTSDYLLFEALAALLSLY